MSQKNSGYPSVIPVKFKVVGNEELVVRQRFHQKYISDDGSLTDGLLAVAQAAHSQLRLLEALLEIDLTTMTQDQEELHGLAFCNKLKMERVKALKKTLRSFETGEFSLRCEDISCPRYSSDGTNCPHKLDIAEAREALPEVMNCAKRRAEDGIDLSLIPKDKTRMRRRLLDLL